jgi:hypothetical protein
MIPSIDVNFGEWMPDQANLDNTLIDALNCISQAKSYRSLRSLVNVSTALDGRCLRAIVAKDRTGVINNFAGDATKLYRLAVGTYANVSKAGDYTVEGWEFIKFGDRIIATGSGAPVQYFDMGVSTLFADLPGSPPQASHAAVIRDFIVLGNLLDGGTEYPARVQWGGFNSSEKWGVDAAVQSDFQDLFGNGGAIQRIVPGDYGVIFQEDSIWRMDYAGPPTIFRFDEVESGRGTLAPNSVTWLGSLVYYWGNDGFYVFNGAGSTPIGSEKVNRYVIDQYDSSRASEFFGIVDRANDLVFWTYPTVGGGSEVIIYNWVTQRWTHSDLIIYAFSEYADPGFTLEELDTIFADIDSASINVDSKEYRGGNVTLGVFDESNKLSNFTGDYLTATIETGEFKFPSGGRAYVSSVRPLVEGGGTYKVSLGQRDAQTGAVSYGPFKLVNPIGECQFHKNTRFTRFKTELAGGFSHASGLEVFYKPAGRI